MIKEGIYTDLSNEDYHADKASLSRSSIKDFYRNPYYYHAMHLNPLRPEKLATRDMIFGSAFHTIILEPEKFNSLYAVEPEKVLLKDVGRDLYDEYKRTCEFLSRQNNLTILTNEEYLTLLEMRKCIVNSSFISLFLCDAEIEKSFFWKDEGSGLMIKARPDILHSNMIVDLKTIRDASARSYQRDMAEGWYHVQGAMIRDAVRILEGRKIDTVINICVEKKYPYCIGIYIIDEDALAIGEKLYKQTLLKMKDCIVNNDFKDYSPQIIGLPVWSM